VGTSYPTIRNTLKENDIEGIQEQKETRSKLVEKTLTEIFTYETYTEESVIDLIFNLKRIGKECGKDLGAFIEDLSIIFDIFYKQSSNPIKLFIFLLDLSDNLSLIYDNIEPEPFNEVVGLYYNKGISIKDADEYLAESKAEKEEIIAISKEIWDDCQKKIKEAKRKLIYEVESKSEIILKNCKQDLKEYNEKIKNAQKELDVIKIARLTIIEELERSEIGNQNLKQTNQALKESLKQANEEKLLLEKVFMRMGAKFPEEVKNIVSEMENES